MAIIFILPLIFLLSAVFFFTFSSSNDPKLPPGPPPLPLIGNLLYLSRNFTLQDIFPLLRNLRPHYGPIITLRIGTIPTIFILDSSLAHKALIEQSTTFANRPTPNPATSFLSGNNLCITSAQYGHTWRLLRRNLTSEILHPSSIGHFSHGRSWVIGIIERDLVSQIHAGNGIVEPMKCFHFAMFCLLVLMCFGEKLDESLIKEIETVQRNFLISTKTLDILALFPWIPKFWFRKRLGEASAQREKQMQIFTPLINARNEKRASKQEQRPEMTRFRHSYVDSLLDIDLLNNTSKKLTSHEIVALCSEFLNAGTDTTSTALQWIMAELVRNRDIQRKLREEIQSIAGGEEHEPIKEEDLHKMPYLKAVVMEGLRLHPPGPLLLPHSVTEETMFEGYSIPKNAIINFTVAEIGRSEEIWMEAMKFMPERFMAGGEGESVDFNGSREIKMLPFGAGRRICPALGLATLHLEYFVANLVKRFEWVEVAGEGVDMSETLEFTMVMKYPLRARLVCRC